MAGALARAIRIAAKRRKNAAHGATACGKIFASATGALKGRGFPAAPYIVFKDLRHGWEAVPLQNFSRRAFFRKLASRG